MKTYCPVHHFNYSGGTCPFCENDRIMFMVHKFDKPKNKQLKKVINENKEQPSQEQLNALMNHFNGSK